MADRFGFDSISLDWLAAKPGAKWHRHPGLLNAWVADMDYPPPPVVVDALRALLDGGDLGYPDHLPGPSGAAAAWSARCGRLYGWTPPLEECRELNDVTQGIQIVLDHFTIPGDGVLVYQPSYPPFLRSVEDAGRIVEPLVGRRSATSPTGWVFDLDEFEALIVERQPRVFLMCHPHNPTGHVYTDDELRGIAAIAERHGILIISDEIHADLTYAPAVHRPMALFAPEWTVTIQAASKAFNLAGLRYAIMHIGPRFLRGQILGQPDHLYGEANLFGSVAAQVAWEQGDEWLDAVVAHLDSMRHLAVDLLHEHLPEIEVSLPAATYLAWLDCRALSLGDDPSLAFAECGVQLSEGPTFGPEGFGRTRLNFATSTEVLTEIVTRMAAVRRGR
ncbi:MAG: MalY/PatB family protein [Ilumatobacteraceae bacterium]